jgi:hypothetical protein
VAERRRVIAKLTKGGEAKQSFAVSFTTREDPEAYSKHRTKVGSFNPKITPHSPESFLGPIIVPLSFDLKTNSIPKVCP